MTYTYNNIDCSRLIATCKSIVNGSIVDERFTTNYIGIIKVVLDNANDMDGNIKLFNTFTVGDLYYQSLTRISVNDEDDDSDDNLTCKTTEQLIEMLYRNINQELI